MAWKKTSLHFSFLNTTDDKFVKGEILLVFKPEVTEQDARTLLEKYSLKEPTNFFKTDYISFYSKDDQLEESALRLKKVPMVKKAEVIGRNKGDIKPWIVVEFSRLVSRDELNDLLKSFDGLYIDPENYPMNIQIVVVPVGKEKYFAEILQKESQVKYAETNGIANIN